MCVVCSAVVLFDSYYVWILFSPKNSSIKASKMNNSIAHVDLSNTTNESPPNDHSVRVERERSGRCESCGQQTYHKILCLWKAITNDQVLNGRCLACNPTPNDHDPSNPGPDDDDPPTPVRSEKICSLCVIILCVVLCVITPGVVALVIVIPVVMPMRTPTPETTPVPAPPPSEPPVSEPTPEILCSSESKCRLLFVEKLKEIEGELLRFRDKIVAVHALTCNEEILSECSENNYSNCYSEFPGKECFQEEVTLKDTDQTCDGE